MCAPSMRYANAAWIPPQAPGPAFVARLVALIEVLLCSDHPTQLAIGATFTAFGYGPYALSGRLRARYVVGVSIADSLALVGLVLLFLYAHRERPRVDESSSHVSICRSEAAF